MIRKGMAELTQTDGGADAWRQFVGPGDVVGIKVNPVGQPHVISSPEVVREIIAGLNSAGVKPKDIIVYDRYRKQFFNAGFDKWLPDEVRTGYAAEDYETIQQGIEGYDPDHYMDMALTLPGYDVSNLTARRSYVARVISSDINKLINLPVLKDHQSAGVTLALKNLSHGSVNNVNRSHGTTTRERLRLLHSGRRLHARDSQQGSAAHSRRSQGALSRRTGREAAVRLGAQDHLFRHRPGRAGSHRLESHRREARSR